MTISYNHLAGKSVERLAALSDGIFGVVMTLLLLQLQEPAKDLIHSENQLLLALWALAITVSQGSSAKFIYFDF